MGDERQKKVRIVHDGGPACLAKVYIDGEQATNVTGVEILMDANDSDVVGVKLTMVDVEFDITGDLADAEQV